MILTNHPSFFEELGLTSFTTQHLTVKRVDRVILRKTNAAKYL